MANRPATSDDSCRTPEAAVQNKIEPAGRLACLGATAVDLLVVLVVFSLAFLLLFSALDTMIRPGTFEVFLIPILALILGGVVFFAINFHLLRRHGQTVGKYAFKIRIVRSNGSPAEMWRILLAGIIRCRHNEIYDTVVVRA